MNALPSRVPPVTARLVLVSLLMLLVAGFSTRVPPQPVSSSPDKGDAGFYQAVAKRLHGGERYYLAYGTELRERGYPAASVFNWRTPLLLIAYSAAPRGASLLLVTMAALTIGATLRLLQNVAPESTVLGLILQVGAASSVLIVAASATVPEAWLGYLLFASIFAYARKWVVGGAILGILALFVRELAAPYCVMCTLFAMRDRRRQEVFTWFSGAVAYSMYFGWHAMSVAGNIEPNDVGHSNSWVQFGGLPFVFGTMGFNGLFAASQPWGPAIGLVLILAALWARSAPLHLRVCCATYAAFFAVVGQPFNQNWGLATSPAWALGCAYGIGGLRRLIRSARHP